MALNKPLNSNIETNMMPSMEAMQVVSIVLVYTCVPDVLHTRIHVHAPSMEARKVVSMYRPKVRVNREPA